jgi:hypothetical protein
MYDIAGVVTHLAARVVKIVEPFVPAHDAEVCMPAEGALYKRGGKHLLPHALTNESRVTVAFREASRGWRKTERWAIEDS